MGFVVDGTPTEVVAAQSEEIAPGGSGQVQIRAAGPETVDECDLRDVEERSA